MAIKLKNKKKIAVVFSGGGVKAAAFHIGVCLALREKGFKFAGGNKAYVSQKFPDDDPMTIRLYVGSSAGSFLAAALAEGYTLEALINAFRVGNLVRPHPDDHSLSHLKPFTYRDIFSLNSTNLLKSIPLSLIRKSIISGGLESFFKDRFTANGIFTTRGFEKYVRESALSNNEFKNLGVELFVIATQLNHTRKAIFGNFPETTKNKTFKYIHYAQISQAVAASISLPPLFAPYMIKNHKNKDMYFFDGEIRDSLSTHVAADHGADFIIGSYSYQPYHYTSEVGSLHKYGIPVIMNQALYQVIQQKIDRNIQYKSDIKSIYNSIDGYLQQIGVDDTHRDKVLSIIRDKVQYKPHVDYLYIHPGPQNHEMFFADHFSLNPKILERILRIGFKSAIHQLREINL